MGAQPAAAVLLQPATVAVQVIATDGALTPMFEARLYETIDVLVGVELPGPQSWRTRLKFEPLGTSTYETTVL